MKKDMKKLFLVVIAFAVAFFYNAIGVNAQVIITDEQQGIVTSEMSTVYAKSGKENYFSYKDWKAYTMLSTVADKNTPAAIPFKISQTGLLYLYAESAYKPVVFEFYYDQELTQPVANTVCSTALDSEGYYTTKVQGAFFYQTGTYYLKISLDVNAEVDEKIYFDSFFIADNDRTLTNDTWAVANAVHKSDNGTYFKVVVSKPGYITINRDNEWAWQSPIDLNTTLLDSSKKAISNENTMYTTYYSPVIYAVKKGTYYIKVSSNNASGYDYRIKYKFTAVTDSSGSTKAKAKTMKIGTSYKGLIHSGGSSVTDWYKFKITSSKKYSLTFAVKATSPVISDEINFTFYKPDGKKSSTSCNEQYPSVVIRYFSDFAKTKQTTWPKGTYYVKISRATSKSSCQYSLVIK